MKIRRIILSMFIFLFIMSSSVFAVGNELSITINGSELKVHKTSILMDGQVMKSNIPSFISGDDRTFIPLRFLEDNFGAEIGWTQKTKTATVEHGDTKLSLTVDSPIVMLNGEPTVMGQDSIPRLVIFPDEDSRTMVPLSFVVEILGYEVGWDNEARSPYINSKIEEEVEEPKEEEEEQGKPVEEDLNKIKNISIEKGSTDFEKVVVSSTGTIEYEVNKSSTSKKLIIDIKNTELDLANNGNKDGKIQAKDENFGEVEYTQHSIDPYITRVTIHRKSTMDYDVVSSKDGKSIIVSFVNRIREFALETVDDNEAIVIKGTGGADFNIMKLSSPERIVIDIMDTVLDQGTYYEFAYTLGFVKGIRVSQFQADNNYDSRDRIVRVVLDIRDGVMDSSIKIDTHDDKLAIYPEKNVWENINYQGEGKEKILTIKNIEKTEYKVDYDPGFKKMEITIPTKSVDLNEGTLFVKDGLVDEIDVVVGPRETKLIIRFRRSIEYELLSKSMDDKIELSIKRDTDINPASRLIVIDPGHGGRHPGASSANGVREKDVNLEISLMLQKELINKGYNILMTRETDEYVDNYDRPKMANEAYADLFISIHSNSTTNKSIHGIEVLYCPAGKSERKQEDQHPFAKSLLDEIIKETGAHSRGVISRPELIVIRDSNMPAALVEVGFLSNANEEKLITNKSYQKKIVDGIIKGIENYFEMY